MISLATVPVLRLSPASFAGSFDRRGDSPHSRRGLSSAEFCRRRLVDLPRVYFQFSPLSSIHRSIHRRNRPFLRHGRQVQHARLDRGVAEDQRLHGRWGDCCNNFSLLFSGLPFAPNSKKWYDPAENEKARKMLWSAPIDPRFPQTGKSKSVTVATLRIELPAFAGGAGRTSSTIIAARS